MANRNASRFSGSKKSKKNISRNDALLSNKTPFQVTEAYKTIRTNLLYSLGATGNQVVVVSSSAPGEGKSTTCANLAVTLAQTGVKVILIDADLRKPVQYKLFHCNNSQGLSKVLVGFSSLEECVKTEIAPNLDLLPSGPTPPNPAELLGSKNMRELLDLLRENYDYILIDTPPINVVTDALVLLNDKVDALLVGRHRQTSYESLGKAVESIQVTNTNLLGVVVTAVREESHGFGSYQYKSYSYEYGKTSR